MFGEDYLAAEYAMLQLRMVCAPIALECVVAHRDLPVPRGGKFKNEYSANAIFTKFGEFHPVFFPNQFNPCMDASAGPFFKITKTG